MQVFRRIPDCGLLRTITARPYYLQCPHKNIDLHLPWVELTTFGQTRPAYLLKRIARHPGNLHSQNSVDTLFSLPSFRNT